MTVVVHGCRSNLAERDALAALVPAGATVINSCAVTAEAVRDGRAAARSARKAGPVFITGCAATLEPARFADLGTVIPNDRKLSPSAWGREGVVVPVSRFSRAFVAVQDGCDHDCTFCVTRIARGPARSVALDDVIGRIDSLVDAGVNEVVLTGIDATSYGLDLPEQPALGVLVQAILGRVPRLRRLRLSSLDAAEADPALVEALSDLRVMPHVHLSLQSGDDLVLKRMKRRHSRADAIRLVERLKKARADICIGADLIAGFPTEGDSAHEASLSLLDACDVIHAHVFPYSPREGTAAARMPQVPNSIARARGAALRQAARERKYRQMTTMLHQQVDVLCEGHSGITPHGFKLRLLADAPRGAIVSATPNAIEGEDFCE